MADLSASTKSDAFASLAALRDQVAALLSRIDTAALPPPAGVRADPDSDDGPGYEWQPARHWRLFTVERSDGEGAVFLDHGCGFPGDWEAFRIEDARRIGLAFLAVAARAETVLAEQTTPVGVGAAAPEVVQFGPRRRRPMTHGGPA